MTTISSSRLAISQNLLQRGSGGNTIWGLFAFEERLYYNTIAAKIKLCYIGCSGGFIRKITVQVGDRQEEYMKRCLETGVFGDSLEDVVQRFITYGIEKVIRDKIVDKIPIKNR